MDDWVVKAITNARTFFLLLGGLIAFFHLLLVYPRNLGKKGWKLVEYVWLAAAALALITISADVRIRLAKNYLRTEEVRTVSAFENLQYTVTEGHPSYINVKFVRSEFSPENLEEMQKEYDRAYDWYREVSTRLPKKIEPDFPELEFSSMPRLEVTEGILVESRERVKELFQSYMNQRGRMIEISDMIPESAGEGLFLVLSPFLLCIGLALRITKVTGEIRLENQSNVREKQKPKTQET